MSLPREYKLPIHHPDYRYPPSKNPYWAKIQDYPETVYLDQQTETHMGQWRTRFPDSKNHSQARELHVEIGCNAGHVIVEWATAHPEHAYIGMDWKFKPIHRAAEKAIQRNLKNLIFFRAHAERLAYAFGPQEIDRLYLFFPDPWAKKSQWKNRWITAERLKQIATLMKPQGIFHIKTDHRGYFDWISDAAAQCTDQWEVIEYSTDLHAHHPHPQELKIPEVTLFERLFIKDGLPIHSLKLRVKAPSGP